MFECSLSEGTNESHSPRSRFTSMNSQRATACHILHSSVLPKTGCETEIGSGERKKIVKKKEEESGESALPAVMEKEKEKGRGSESN